MAVSRKYLGQVDDLVAQLPDADAHRSTHTQVLADLRQSRRRRRTADIDVGEAVYKVYITAILSGVAIWLLSGLTGDQHVAASAIRHVVERGPQVVGAAVGLAWAVGLRSGGRGGPLVIEAADVRHVLLAPVDRALAMRSPAVRQLRFGASAGAGIGAVGGLLAFRRLGGDPVVWLLCGAATGVLAVAGSLALAMVVSGRRLGRLVGGGAALAVAAWSAADYVTRSTTSPATWLGELALWPLLFRPGAFIGVAVAFGAVAIGLWVVGGTSVEAAERRATLVGQMRFAATMKDLRTVVVLRRQLSQELPRQRPWVRWPRSIPWPAGSTGTARRRPFPSWRRAWHGIMRFPGLRFARMALLGAAAGAALVGVWRGTTPLVVVAGICMYVAGLDAVEPMAQELDHPDRHDEYPVAAGEVLLRQLGPSLVLMLGVSAVALAVGVAVTGGLALAAELGGLILLPAAACGVAGATISVIQGPPPVFSSTDSMMPPEMAGIRMIFRTVWPPAVATAGVLPLLAARAAARARVSGGKAAAGTAPAHTAAGTAAARSAAHAVHLTPVGAAASYAVPAIVLAGAVGVWVRYRDPIHAWFKAAMQEANATKNASAGAGASAKRTSPAGGAR